MIQTADLFEPIIKVVMIMFRAGALWMYFPVFSQSTIPRFVKLAGAMTFCMALLPSVGPHLMAWSLVHPPTWGEIIAFAFREFLIGAGMGLGARWIFASITASAHWVGMQMGFSAGSMIDPEFQMSDTSWSELHHWISIMVFFSIGGHLMLIKAVSDSYLFDFSDFSNRLMDPAIGARFWIEVGGRFFAWMLRLSGPIVVVLLFLQAALGILSKFIPQINIWSVSIPITIATGVLVLAVLSPMYGDALANLFTVQNETSQLWLKAMGTR